MGYSSLSSRANRSNCPINAFIRWASSNMLPMASRSAAGSGAWRKAISPAVRSAVRGVRNSCEASAVNRRSSAKSRSCFWASRRSNAASPSNSAGKGRPVFSEIRVPSRPISSRHQPATNQPPIKNAASTATVACRILPCINESEPSVRACSASKKTSAAAAIRPKAPARRACNESRPHHAFTGAAPPAASGRVRARYAGVCVTDCRPTSGEAAPHARRSRCRWVWRAGLRSTRHARAGRG